MTEEEKKTIWGRIGKPVVIVLSIILIFTIVFLIFVYLSVEVPQYPRYAAPTVAYEMEYNDTTDTYRLYVINISYELEIDEFKYILYNDINTVENDLEVVLNNENSSITFYDMDDDGFFSAGDEFINDGDIVEPDAVFIVIWRTNRKVVLEMKFGE